MNATAATLALAAPPSTATFGLPETDAHLIAKLRRLEPGPTRNHHRQGHTMNAEREELAGLLFTTDNSKSVEPWSEWDRCKHEPRLVEYVYAMADAILAAGYRKPRTITTAEELDALPDGSIIRETDGTPTRAVKHESGANWWTDGPNGMSGSLLIPLPATVLYEPQS